MASSSTTTSFLLFLLLPILSHAATFNVVNNCRYTVWAAATPGGGQQLNPGQSWTINVAGGTTMARIWGRTGCGFDSNGNGHCNTGDCGGRLHCTAYGSAPNTLAEYALNQYMNLDFYDISVIQGFNVPMNFASACKVLHCPDSNCPDAYHYPSDDTKTNACPSGGNFGVTFCP